MKLRITITLLISGIFLGTPNIWCSFETSETENQMSNTGEVISIRIGETLHSDHIINHRPVISWDSKQSDNIKQVSYQLILANENNFQENVIWDSGRKISTDQSIKYAETELVDGHCYYLKILVEYSNNTTNTEIDSFCMNAKPTEPELLYPREYTFVSQLQPKLVAGGATDENDDELFYIFRLYRDKNLTDLIAISDTIPEKTNRAEWTTEDTLNYHDTYYWKAEVIDGYEAGVESNVGTFSITHIRNFWGFLAYFSALFVVIITL